MKNEKDWLQKTWEIKAKIAKETKDFSSEEYWKFIDKNAKDAKETLKRIRSKRPPKS